MKIIVSANGPNLEALVDAHFGAAPYFLIIDIRTLELEVVPNQSSLQAPQGVGIQAAALVARQQPVVVLTGHCGPKAFHSLQDAGISVVVGVEGCVRDAVHDLRAGKLIPARGPNVPRCCK
jgi:predicted Fe-Mo cluster-binding NifX family protein